MVLTKGRARARVEEEEEEEEKRKRGGARPECEEAGRRWQYTANHASVQVPMDRYQVPVETRQMDGRL